MLLDRAADGWLVDEGCRVPSPHAYHDGYKPGRVLPVECVVYLLEDLYP
tara:strand:- start:92 stop:238 length:147 start_codon:yes stop_codon:yes gene_type:complete